MFRTQVDSELLLYRRAGNPLAVGMNTCGLATEKMLAIAREFSLSETSFAERRTAAVKQPEGVRMRIFTTQSKYEISHFPNATSAKVTDAHVPGPHRSWVNRTAFPARIHTLSTGCNIRK
jgi:predicted PhzF superfamily epimerase YddE/YHI9